MLGDYNMKEKHLKLNQSILIASVLLFLTLTPITVGLEGNIISPALEITAIKGGLAQVSIEIKNTGDTVAEDVALTISVKGGLLNRINIYKKCTGCGHCNTSIPPNGTKKERTSKPIFGLGSVDIIATANATGVPTIEKTAKAFIIGPFVLIQ